MIWQFVFSGNDFVQKLCIAKLRCKKEFAQQNHFCIAIYEFCIANLKCLELQYAVFKTLLSFGSSYAYNVQILPEICWAYDP